jgi:2-enoate reductase
MQAAQVSAKRGHDVVLYEAGDRLGGHFNEASSLSYKDYHRHYLAWDIRETMECGAEIVFNTPVTPELVEKEAPDTLIIAAGAEHIRPNIKGIENSCTVSDIDLGRVKAGKRVVYCGGGVSSTESAIGLAEEGRECVILDFLPYSKLHLDVFGNVKAALRYKMDEDHIRLFDETTVMEIGPNFVKGVREGKEITFECDTVVTGFGLAPDQELIESLSHLVYETYVIGDANKVGKVMEANHSAFNVCIEL